MKAAQIEDGRVANVILVDSLELLPNLVDGESANIGDLWDGSVFIPQPVPVVVPDIVSPRQFRRALIQWGLLDTVEAYMATASLEIRTDWEYATEIRRDYPAWDQLAAAVGKTIADVDALFCLAETFI
jgi:hypothetical protein